MLLLGFDGPLHHLAAAARVQREHADGELGAGLDGLGDSVGDIVELEIEKDAEAHSGDLAHAIGAARGEHLQAHLHPPHGALELAEHGGDFARGLGVEDEDEIAGHRFEPLMNTDLH